ncbi:MAG: glycosyltransferase family 2 protein [Candidatus Levybacteria bacterium]|nr:glycosyltransferase family 2 protein [Candidatus Levybacteria bacterium]
MNKTLSVVLATFNEEKNLDSCLTSVEGIADEIIVVDGGSRDKTIEIAKKHNARIHITTNPQNFHINKQMAIDMATCDWILQLDADERASPELAKEIKEKIRNLKLEIRNSVNGYWIPRKNWFLGRFLMKGGVYPDYTLRLYRRGKGRLPQKDVHEQAVVGGRVEYLTNSLTHMADPTFSRYLSRFRRYTDFISKQYKDKKLGKDYLTMVKYILILPIWWFFTTYIRHKGFMDSWQGFVFAFFSALRFPISYLKYIKE